MHPQLHAHHTSFLDSGVLVVQDEQIRHPVCSVDTRVSGHITVAQRHTVAQLGQSSLRIDATCIPGDRLGCCLEHVSKCWNEHSAFVKSAYILIYI